MTTADLAISIEGTPNPNAAKFVLDRPVPGSGSRSYFDATETEDDPLASRLFALNGVRALLLVDNFITVTKTEGADWDDLVQDVQAIIRAELADESG